MAVKKKSTAPKKKVTPKKKAVAKKKPPGKPTGKVDLKRPSRKRNKNNLTDQEQAFADTVLTNKDGRTATDIVMEIHPNILRTTARVKASNWMADERIRAYQDKMRSRAEDAVEYDLVQWRKDVLELIEIGMGRKGRPQSVSIKQEDGQTVRMQLDGVKEFEGNVAKGALELIARQMKLLTDKTEMDVGDQLREIFSKVKPTTGPPCIRGAKGNDD